MINQSITRRNPHIMKRSTRNTAVTGIGGAIVVSGLLAGAAMVSAQADEPVDDGDQTTTTTIEQPAPIDDTPTPPWADGESPWADGDIPFGRGRFGGEGSPFGEGGPFGAGGPGFGIGGDDLAADLGLTAEELAAAFESGQTLPEIAEANGVDLDDLFEGRFNGEGGSFGGRSTRWAETSEEG